MSHPISSDNGLISRTFSKVRILLPITCGNGCCLLMFEMVFLSQSDMMFLKMCIQHCKSPWPRKSRFYLIFVLGRVRDAVYFILSSKVFLHA